MKFSSFKRREPSSTVKRKRVTKWPVALAIPARAAIQTIADACTVQPKAVIVRSEAYRRAVAGLPCVICGIAGYSQAAHSNTGKGMALKACDSQLFPACCDRPGVRGCHSQLDQGALFSKAVRRELEQVWVADSRRKLEIMGVKSPLAQ